MEQLFNLELETFHLILIFWGLIAIPSALSIMWVKVLPMSSRADNSKLGLLGTIDKRMGWIIMEIPVIATVLLCYWAGIEASGSTVNVSVVFVAAFVVHYFNRGFIFPFRIKVAGKRMPVVSMLSSMMFYIINSYLIGYYFGALKSYPLEWLWDPRFIIGILVFLGGFVINIQSDNILMRLRAPGESGYKIPKGGLYKYVSCPNYLGEILEWVGFAIMSWSLMGVVYAFWVALPLIPQAILAHRWYQEKFPATYPLERKAIFPYLI
ncbi:MAG: 3-oxo-5-alpha-steroid 4-dehydrogenase [Oceanococcus sp.]